MRLPWIVSSLVLAGGLLLVPTTSSGKPEYTRMTNQDCSYCHIANSRKLTDAGAYYRKHRTLKGFVPAKTQ